MNLAQIVFKATDGIFYPLQNIKRYRNVMCRKDISYGSHPLTTGDLYYKPEILNDGKKHPIILYYHGGGFVMGDKKCRVSISEFYADAGYFVFNVNYRMPPEVFFPEYLYDCVNAANYIENLAEEYNIDLNKIVVTGDSSGGYNATYMECLACNPGLNEKINCPSLKVKFRTALLMGGIYDLDVLIKGPKFFGVIPKTAQLIFGDFPLKYNLSNINEHPYAEYLSPSVFVNEKWCDTFMSWSKNDVLCPNQGEKMAGIIKKYASVFESFVFKPVQNNHCFHLDFGHSRAAMGCMQQSLDFLQRVLSEETVNV